MRLAIDNCSHKRGALVAEADDLLALSRRLAGLGRPDAVLRTEKGIYVFEFKYAQSADAALRQCRDRNYAARFVGESRPVYYVGVNYDPKARTISEVRAEPAAG